MARLFAILSLFLTVGCTYQVEAPMGYDEESENSSAPVDGWSTSGSLTTGNQNVQVGMQANFPKADVYTVLFGFLPNTTVAGFGAQVLADIVWSVEGNDVTRTVSVANGTSVTGVGQAVRVTIRDATLSAFFPAGAVYRVSAQVSRGTRACGPQFPLLIGGFVGGGADLGPGLYTVAHGATVNVPIPTNAGVISVYVTVQDLGAVKVVPTIGGLAQQQNSVGGVSGPGWNPGVSQYWVPVFPGMDTLILANQNAANQLAFSVTFGIDG